MLVFFYFFGSLLCSSKSNENHEADYFIDIEAVRKEGVEKSIVQETKSVESDQNKTDTSKKMAFRLSELKEKIPQKDFEHLLSLLRKLCEKSDYNVPSQSRTACGYSEQLDRIQQCYHQGETDLHSENDLKKYRREVGHLMCRLVLQENTNESYEILDIRCRKSKKNIKHGAENSPLGKQGKHTGGVMINAVGPSEMFSNPLNNRERLQQPNKLSILAHKRKQRPASVFTSDDFERYEPTSCKFPKLYDQTLESIEENQVQHNTTVDNSSTRELTIMNASYTEMPIPHDCPKTSTESPAQNVTDKLDELPVRKFSSSLNTPSEQNPQLQHREFSFEKNTEVINFKHQPLGQIVPPFGSLPEEIKRNDTSSDLNDNKSYPSGASSFFSVDARRLRYHRSGDDVPGENSQHSSNYDNLTDITQSSSSENPSQLPPVSTIATTQYISTPIHSQVEPVDNDSDCIQTNQELSIGQSGSPDLPISNKMTECFEYTQSVDTSTSSSSFSDISLGSDLDMDDDEYLNGIKDIFTKNPLSSYQTSEPQSPFKVCKDIDELTSLLERSGFLPNAYDTEDDLEIIGLCN